MYKINSIRVVKKKIWRPLSNYLHNLIIIIYYSLVQMIKIDLDFMSFFSKFEWVKTFLFFKCNSFKNPKKHVKQTNWIKSRTISTLIHCISNKYLLWDKICFLKFSGYTLCVNDKINIYFTSWKLFLRCIYVTTIDFTWSLHFVMCTGPKFVKNNTKVSALWLWYSFLISYFYCVAKFHEDQVFTTYNIKL